MQVKTQKKLSMLHDDSDFGLDLLCSTQFPKISSHSHMATSIETDRLFTFSPANRSNISRCNFMNTSSGIPRFDKRIINWWFKKTAWGREVCSTSIRRWELSNLRMLGRKTAMLSGSLGSSVRTPLHPAKRTWIAEGKKVLAIFLATCQGEEVQRLSSVERLNQC